MKQLKSLILRLNLFAGAILLLTALLVSCSEGNMRKKGEKSGADTCAKQVCSPAEKRRKNDSIADGDYVVRYPNGIIRMKGLYKNGKREGEWVAFFENGKVQSEGYFTNGKRDHHAIVYSENGKKMYEGDYKEGVQVGKWNYYKEDGSLKDVVDYGKGDKAGGK
ncbi:MAG: toxin-antitoxin system YwqK family antitoxin [Bacteroidia bacterium]